MSIYLQLSYYTKSQQYAALIFSLLITRYLIFGDNPVLFGNVDIMKYNLIRN